MSFQYTENRYVRQEVTVTFKIPTDWGMYTSAGNKSLSTKANRLVSEIEAAKDTLSKMRSFENFFKGWKRMADSETMDEAGDTAVRDEVWGFALSLGKAKDINQSIINDVWESMGN
jgi:hypothetical protein